MAETGRDTNDPDLKARLEKLSAALDAQRGGASADAPHADASRDNGRTGRALSLGVRVLSEFIAAILVGGVIGWQTDVWFGTSPAGMVVFLGLGTAAGFWNLYRLAREREADDNRPGGTPDRD